jgi:hypothetical protein
VEFISSGPDRHHFGSGDRGELLVHLWRNVMDFYLPGQKKEFRWKRIKAFCLGFIIAALIFTGLGYAWRMAQTKGPYQEEISQLKAKIDHYRENWTPIQSKESSKKKVEK